MRQRTLTTAFMVAVGVLLGGVVVLAQKPGPGSAKEPPRPPSLTQTEIPPPPRPGVEDPPSREIPPRRAPRENALGVEPRLELAPAIPGDATVPPPRVGVSTPSVDPMQDVDAFLEQNRKRAADSIQKLTKEAEELRARLSRVEKALQRWQMLSAALDRSADVPPLTSIPLPENPPTELSPAPIERAPAEIPPPRAPGEASPPRRGVE